MDGSEDTPNGLERNLADELAAQRDLAAAAESFGFEPDAELIVRARSEADKWHTHVAIAWEGGVVWLDMMHLSDHYCIDVRSLRGGELLPIGVMSLIEGYRVTLDDSGVPEEKRLTAHGWKATHVPMLLIDKPSNDNDQEDQ